MDPAFLEKIFTVYGPLGLGWVGFFWAMARVFSLQTSLMQISTDTAKALTLLTERITGGKQ